MKVIFAGTSEFSATLLSCLTQAGHHIVTVLTQPDKPSGRGMKTTFSHVKKLALLHQWPLLQPTSLNDNNLHKQLHALNADILVVAAYGKLLSPPLLNIGYGAINVHASLLPRWRGAAPIERAIAAGDRETGISIMKMTKGLDEGPVYTYQSTTIEEQEDAITLTSRLSKIGAQALLQVLQHPDALTASPQSITGITYAKKINTSDGHIQFDRNPMSIGNQWRAFHTNPGCFFVRKTPPYEKIRIGLIQPETSTPPSLSAPPGSIIAIEAQDVVIQCMDGAIRLLQLQRPGRRMMHAADVLRGLRMSTGTLL